SPFVKGLPGIGLLILRLAAGTALVFHEIGQLRFDDPVLPTVLLTVRGSLAILLFCGLWTPVAGTLAVIAALASLYVGMGDVWAHSLVASIGIALAFLGPGAWSLDAWLFGWRRIEIPDRR